jgi:hypothetical protein
MEMPNVPPDDLLDVLEMTKRLELHMGTVLNENDLTLAMSALMSATINCVISQCKTLEEVMIYRQLFFQFFDASIRSIKIQEK